MRIIVNETSRVPQGVYPVRLVSVKQQQGQYGNQVIWVLEITSGEYRKKTLKAWTNLSSAITSKSVQWASAFAGRQFQAGEEIDFSRLIGKRALAKVATVENAEGVKYTKVISISKEE